MDTASQTLTLVATVGHSSTCQTGMTLANSFRDGWQEELRAEKGRCFCFDLGRGEGQWTLLLSWMPEWAAWKRASET